MEISFIFFVLSSVLFMLVFIICTLLYCIHIYMYNFYPNKSNQKYVEVIVLNWHDNVCSREWNDPRTDGPILKRDTPILCG